MSVRNFTELGLHQVPYRDPSSVHQTLTQQGFRNLRNLLVRNLRNLPAKPLKSLNGTTELEPLTKVTAGGLEGRRLGE
jgi:hypothetical protein